ncbi:MAG: hypothetical protein OXF06_01450 [Bacteroidetes bacterium]|nr:hypothetical protein [Bacteroidota bacterium]
MAGLPRLPLWIASSVSVAASMFSGRILRSFCASSSTRITPAAGVWWLRTSPALASPASSLAVLPWNIFASNPPDRLRLTV